MQGGSGSGSGSVGDDGSGSVVSAVKGGGASLGLSGGHHGTGSGSTSADSNSGASVVSIATKEGAAGKLTAILFFIIRLRTYKRRPPTKSRWQDSWQI